MNITFNWYHSFYAVICFAAQNRRTAFTFMPKNPGSQIFVVRFEADFQEFYNYYDIALIVCNAHYILIPAYFPTPA